LLQNVHGGTVLFSELMRFSRKPFPINGIVQAGAIIHSSHLLPQTPLLGPILKLQQQGFSGNYKLKEK